MVFHLIKKHFYENKTVFILFIICQIVSLLIALFIFNLLDLKDKYSEYNRPIYRTLYVTNVNESDDINLYNNMLDAPFMNDIETVESKLLSDNIIINIILYCDADSKEIIDAGIGITADDVKENKNVAIVNPKIKVNDKQCSVGDAIQLFGQNYEVIGLSSSITGITVPGNESIFSDIDYFNIVYKGELRDSEVSDLMSTIKEIFPSADISKVAEKPEKNFEITLEDIIIVLTIILVNINFLSLYLYILDRSKLSFSVFKICGCSPKKLTVILISEITVICLGALIMAVLIFWALGSSIFSFMNPLLVYTFSIKATLRTALAYTLGVLVVFLPAIYNFSKKCPYRIYSEETV